MESALKLARQYWLEAGQPQRSVFIARRQSYHGNTLGALAVGGNEWRRAPFAPLLIAVPRVSPCFEYRERADGQSTEDYTAALLRELEDAILAAGPENVIGFVAETVVGATAGAVPPTPGYFRGVRKLCDQYGLLLILDEVMCGMGRCGTLYAFEQEGCCPTWWCWAKGWAPATSRLARCWRGPTSCSACATAAAPSSMATPTWATRWPPPPRWRCRT
jgi:adenosylmethionine-8-amino-7-oxononanoate aminotransferase